LASLAGVESVAGATQATGFALEARGVALSSAVVESRLGPGLVKDLQQQFATLEEGEGRTVELRLDPPELGRITVRISLVGEEARVAFTAMQSGAREALEAALPRLREMFEEAGLTLGDAAVDSGSQREGRAQKPADRGSEAGLSLELEEEGAAVERAPTVNSLARGRLDLHV
jgi:flagellar hook-length control protein FliK